MSDLPKSFEDFVPVHSSSPIWSKSPLSERPIADFEKSDELEDSCKKIKIRERAKYMFTEVNNLCLYYPAVFGEVIESRDEI